MENTLITVIIPTFNRSRVLVRAVQSVIDQTYRNFELIVIDDGSSDNTGNILSRFDDNRIRYIRFESNRGQNVARNTGIMAAKGCYFAFLDSDDEWRPDFLAKVMVRFHDEPGLGCVYTWAMFHQSETGSMLVSKEFSIEGNIFREALAQGYVSHTITMVVKKRDAMEAGLFDPYFSVCDDDDFCLRLARKCSFGLIKEPLAVIHVDGGEQITRDLSKYAEGFHQLITKFAQDIKEECGPVVLAAHYEKCGDLFWRADNREMALSAYGMSTKLQRRQLGCLKQWLLNLGLKYDLALCLIRIGSMLCRGKSC